MKKIITFFMSAVMIFSLAACGSNGGSSTSQPSPSTTQPSESVSQAPAPSSEPSAESIPSSESTPEPVSESKNTLVVYFSMPETTDPNNMTQDEDQSVVVIDGKVLGNTQYVAQLIQENTDADIFRIEPKTPYPTDHDTLVDLAKQEQNDAARPELAANVDNLEQYDVIFLGYPNWWGDMPMVLYSFLESHDLSGKTIIPFNTHGGSGFSDSINTIAKLQPNATVNKDGFTVSRNTVEDCADDVAAWVDGLGYAK